MIAVSISPVFKINGHPYRSVIVNGVRVHTTEACEARPFAEYLIKAINKTSSAELHNNDE